MMLATEALPFVCCNPLGDVVSCVVLAMAGGPRRKLSTSVNYNGQSS